jgi:hypothetical protein
LHEAVERLLQAHASSADFMGTSPITIEEAAALKDSARSAKAALGCP